MQDSGDPDEDHGLGQGANRANLAGLTLKTSTRDSGQSTTVNLMP